jgi:hypothetical protein
MPELLATQQLKGSSQHCLKAGQGIDEVTLGLRAKLPSRQERVKLTQKATSPAKEEYKVGEQRNVGAFRKVEERYRGYDVVDIDHDKIGSVDATYVNETNQREYIAVSGGLSSLLPGTANSHLIPMDVCTVDNNRRIIEVSLQKDVVENSPSLSGSTELTPEYEEQVRSYYRL